MIKLGRRHIPNATYQVSKSLIGLLVLETKISYKAFNIYGRSGRPGHVTKTV